MKIGKMRYRITIEDYIVTTDKDGFQKEEWIPFTTVWADIVPVSSKEMTASSQSVLEVTSKIYIRYLKGLKSTMRVKCGDRIFEIASLLIDERNGTVVLLAREVF